MNNPYSQFQDEYSLEEILAAPMVHAPLTKLQCCPTSDGSVQQSSRARISSRSTTLQDKGG